MADLKMTNKENLASGRPSYSGMKYGAVQYKEPGLHLFPAVPGLGRWEVPPHVVAVVLVFLIEGFNCVRDLNNPITVGTSQYLGFEVLQKDIFEIGENTGW